ncbi:MAG: NDP-sugar synthase [Blastocatellia bacterium]|nr:NDP-sugar synthase [Blastocatellia bacterium]
MKAMILAAGFGTRLWPLTVGRTKPAIPFLNRPLIASTIEYLRRFGVTELIVNLHHEPESVREQIGDGSQYGVRIGYSMEEPEILGTSGALDRVRDQLEQETFLVVNGKIITDLDLGAALETHRRRQALATLVLRPNPKRERFSEILLGEEGRVARFGGFPEVGGAGTPLMFTGIHILDPAIFEYIPRGVFSDSVRDVYPKAMAEGRMVAAHIGEGAWYELSTLERYLAISLEFLAREGRDVVMDEGCAVAADARIERSILWKRVTVERGAVLTDCIVGDDVTIPAQARFSRAVIFRADRAPLSERPEKALPGMVVDKLLVVSLA